MTNEELQAHIDAIQVAARNGIVEESVDGGSFGRVSAGAVVINASSYKYRIKPQPLVIYVDPEEIERATQCVGACRTFPAHTHPEIPGFGTKMRKFREVIE